MIVGRMQHWRERMKGEAWRKAFEAIETLTPDAPDGRTAIAGDDIYMIVMGYETKPPETNDGNLENHRNYVDIQVTLDGSERIEWFPAETLTPKLPYNPDKDAQYYHRPGAGVAAIDSKPGTFVVLFPEDGHLAKMRAPFGDTSCKKVVVKVRLTLVA
jgi:biofilm protein TabA